MTDSDLIHRGDAADAVHDRGLRNVDTLFPGDTIYDDDVADERDHIGSNAYFDDEAPAIPLSAMTLSTIRALGGRS